MRAALPFLLVSAAPLPAQSLVVPPRGAYQHHALIQPMYDEFDHHTLMGITDVWTARMREGRWSRISISPWITFDGRVPPADLNDEKVQLTVDLTGRSVDRGSILRHSGPVPRGRSLSLTLDRGYRIDVPCALWTVKEDAGPDSTVTLTDQLYCHLSLPDWFALIHASRVEGNVDDVPVVITDTA